MNPFAYDFMRRAFLIAGLLSVAAPMIGHVMVLRRLSAVGDALSHTGLAGVAIGLCFGFNPVLGAVAVSLAAGLSIEAARRRFSRYGELAVSIVLSVGVGLAALFSGFVKNGNFGSFLFGSIVAVGDGELWGVAGLSLLVCGMMLALRKPLLYLTFDEEGAAVAGVKVKRVQMLFTLVTALTVAIASRTVGALVISSLMTLPVACSMQVARGYRDTLIWGVAFALTFALVGLIVAFYADVKPGGSIVLTGVLVLAGLLAGKSIATRTKGGRSA